MNRERLQAILESLRDGDVTVSEAMKAMQRWPFEALPFAHIDHHRTIRCGMPETIFCPGKTPEQVTELFTRLAETGETVLASRADEAVFQAVQAAVPAARYEFQARMVVLDRQEAPPSSAQGYLAVVSAGTADIPVAEEARVTAECMGQPVRTIYDVGVSGLQRLLSHLEALQEASVIVVVAGMEGALASVVGGLVASPVIAVPTSVGYGANFDGLAPLLTMLNSCAAGVSVVNIDNGFSAGYIAATINRQRHQDRRNASGDHQS